jgi:hypothetical protein
MRIAGTMPCLAGGPALSGDSQRCESTPVAALGAPLRARLAACNLIMSTGVYDPVGGSECPAGEAIPGPALGLGN